MKIKLLIKKGVTDIVTLRVCYCKIICNEMTSKRFARDVNKGLRDFFSMDFFF